MLSALVVSQTQYTESCLLYSAAGEVTVGYVVCRHGDMVFLDIDQDATSASEMSVDSTPTPSTVTGNQSSSASLSSMMSRPSFSSRDVVADSVDEFLWNQDGKIPRQRNEQL